MPARYQPVLDKLADATVASLTTTVDADLESVGFDKIKQGNIHEWSGLSPARKIETAYWAAERARSGSGESFLALLSRRLSSNHRTLETDGDVRPFLQRSPGPVEYGSLRTASPFKPSDRRITSAIAAMSRELEGHDGIRTENLLRAGGMSTEQVYDVLRESGPSRQAALLHAVQSRAPAEQAKMLNAMAQHFIEHRGPRPVPPEIQEFVDRHGGGSPPGGPAMHDPRHPRPPGPDGLDGTDGRRRPPHFDADMTESGPDRPRARPPGPHGGGGGAGLWLGDTKLEQPAARPLPRQGFSAGRGGMGAAIRNIRFVGRNGGVSFGEIAAPKAGTRVPSLSLRYDASKPDGSRAITTIAGKDYAIEAADWILLPAAEWSSDKDVGLVTGFGSLQDEDQRASCGLVFNYAPAVQGTLMGLRLMQADVVLWPGYGDLFKLDGRYVLGTGEVAPTADELTQRRRLQVSLEPTLPSHQSYVFTDADLKMTFEPKQGRIVFAGEPVYRLWRTPEPAFAGDDGIDKLSAPMLVKRAEQAEKALRSRLDVGLTDERDVRVRENVRALAEFVRSPRRSIEARRAALRFLERSVAGSTVTIIADRENPLSNPRTIEALNPTVYKAVTRFAQLAAWFRYVQANHPAAWTAFSKQIPRAASAEPRVPLPTCGPRQ